VINKNNNRFFNYSFNDEQLKADIIATHKKFGKVYVVMNESFENFFYSVISGFETIEEESGELIGLIRWEDYYHVRVLIDNSLDFGEIEILGSLNYLKSKRYEYNPNDIISLAELRRDAVNSETLLTVYANEWTKEQLENEKEYFEDNTQRFVDFYGITIAVKNELEDGVLERY
jgi:hypothetical protein